MTEHKRNFPIHQKEFGKLNIKWNRRVLAAQWLWAIDGDINQTKLLTTFSQLIWHRKESEINLFTCWGDKEKSDVRQLLIHTRRSWR